ncbi:uncharacterized protein [Malus domestica]|uniref:uncharacterized protein n=1 Tax=Malus domestica TaxID=3750 RepID=UPI0010A9C953|nr:uncharacterized protein LOC103449621 [Malus domestica]
MATTAKSSNSPSSPNSRVNLPSSEIYNLSIMSIGSISIENVAGMIPTKLNRQNYITWRNLFIPVLKCFKLLGLVNGDDLCPSEFVLNSSGSRVFNPLYETWYPNDSEGDSSMIDYLNSIKDISDKLTAGGEPISEYDLVAYILSGLPDDYESFVNSIETRNESVTADELHGLLLTKEISLQKRKTRASFSSTAPFHAYAAQSNTSGA